MTQTEIKLLKQRDELVKILSAVAPRICNPDLWERIDKILTGTELEIKP